VACGHDEDSDGCLAGCITGKEHRMPTLCKKRKGWATLECAGVGRVRHPREDIKQDILTTGIRKLERSTGVSHHTLERILRGEPVRRKTLAKIIKSVSRQSHYSVPIVPVL
jgi:hypothetical protein